MMSITGRDLAALLESKHYDCSTEEAFQQRTAIVLAEASLTFTREHRFNVKDRVDFFVDPGIALELKIAGAPNAVLRQLMRYVVLPEVQEVVLFTTRAKHCAVPETLNGKPLHVALYQHAF